MKHHSLPAFPALSDRPTGRRLSIPFPPFLSENCQRGFWVPVFFFCRFSYFLPDWIWNEQRLPPYWWRLPSRFLLLRHPVRNRRRSVVHVLLFLVLCNILRPLPHNRYRYTDRRCLQIQGSSIGRHPYDRWLKCLLRTLLFWIRRWSVSCRLQPENILFFRLMVPSRCLLFCQGCYKAPENRHSIAEIICGTFSR